MLLGRLFRGPVTLIGYILLIQHSHQNGVFSRGRSIPTDAACGAKNNSERAAQCNATNEYWIKDQYPLSRKYWSIAVLMITVILISFSTAARASRCLVSKSRGQFTKCLLSLALDCFRSCKRSLDASWRRARVVVRSRRTSSSAEISVPLCWFGLALPSALGAGALALVSVGSMCAAFS